MIGVSPTRRVGQSERVHTRARLLTISIYILSCLPAHTLQPFLQMLARQLQSSITSNAVRRAVQSNVRAPLINTNLTRGYARSRYSERNPGVGRSRDRPERLLNNRPIRDDPPLQEQYTYGSAFKSEQQPSAEESPLWEASQRPPASNPEEGLRKILLENDVLVVTRCVQLPASVTLIDLDNLRCRQIEMLNIFVGFEQANRYVICEYTASVCPNTC